MTSKFLGPISVRRIISPRHLEGLPCQLRDPRRPQPEHPTAQFRISQLPATRRHSRERNPVSSSGIPKDVSMSIFELAGVELNDLLSTWTAPCRLGRALGCPRS